MKEQDLKRNLLVERREVVVPKKAVLQAIDAGTKRAGGRTSQRVTLRRLVTVVAVLGIALIGTGISGLADGVFDQFVRIPAVESFYKNMTISPENNQRAKAFEMKNGIGYWAEGQKSVEAKPNPTDIQVKPGIYDVTLTQGAIGELLVGGVLLPGETYKSYWLEEGNYSEVFGKNAVLQFTPANFEPLTKTGDHYELENVFGDFEIGKAIEAGIYRVEVTGASEYGEGWSVMVGTSNTFADGSGASGGSRFSKESFGAQIVEMRTGSVMKISREYTSEDESVDAINYPANVPNVHVTLTKIAEEGEKIE